MQTFIDWNNDLLSSMRIDLDSGADEAISALTYMQTELQVSRYCMMPILDASKTPVSVFSLKQNAYKGCLSEKLPKGIDIRYSARVLLQPGLSEYEDLVTLTKETNGYLPIVLPIGEYRDWIDQELNRLLYRCKLKLLLTSCEQIPILYPNVIVEKLFRIPDAVFQFHYNSLTDIRIGRLIYNLASLNKTILFGTAVNSLAKAYRLDLPYCYDAASAHFSKGELHHLFYVGRKFWNN